MYVRVSMIFQNRNADLHATPRFDFKITINIKHERRSQISIVFDNVGMGLTRDCDVVVSRPMFV